MGRFQDINLLIEPGDGNELYYLPCGPRGRGLVCPIPFGPAVNVRQRSTPRLIGVTSMANTFPEVTAVSVETGTAEHYVDWGAIAAGVFVAIAVSSVFLAFGSAIGLSLTSFHASESAPVIGLVIAAGLWLLWVQISSFIGGAYVAGRMRRRIGDAKAHEVEMRDGAHGLIVWAVNIVIGVVLAGWITIAGVSWRD